MNRLLMLLCLLSSPALLSQNDLFFTEKEQALYNKIGSNLRCPTCVSLGILESDAPFSRQMKSALQEQVRLGKSEKEILAFFTDRYGLWILRSPPTQGIHLLAWIIPLSLFILGIAGIWYAFFTQKNHKGN
jgi:cytochrome c-type biogenesis protein CcmH/NrfF